MAPQIGAGADALRADARAERVARGRDRPDDAGGVYVTAMDALDLPTGPLGDWHATMWRPPEESGASTRTPRTEALCRLGGELWAREELVDARDALRRIGHPMGTAPEPVSAASHPRATAELVMSALCNTGRIDPDPHDEWIHAVSARRGLIRGED